ncbi:putative helitron helicase-like domain at N-terminus [Lyophyllum shimeji]|uniref:ATP-dependent DNA helicase n=1 Tax=Lyophyllum shimeji TaxID=47721 RepID=A0A9P3PXY5_LYOSH|nr:putative helitron helicase-like domain at N-terminus [Lyophyllum shimeji]
MPTANEIAVILPAHIRRPPFLPSPPHVNPDAQLPDAPDEAPEKEAEVNGNTTATRRRYVSKVQFYRYRLYLHPPAIDSQHLFLSQKLFQEFVCDVWATAEQSRLRWVWHNQNTIRGDIYAGLADAVAANVDASTEELGRRIILPATFAGSTRNMQQLLQDALAINRFYHGGDLFITMTANPNWVEIKTELLPGQTAANRSDLVIRVFYRKKDQLIEDIKKGVFGKVVAYLFVIEFQKRGLPHMHCILFLDQESKLQTPEHIDSLISSEFPEDNPEMLELIKKFMVHTPCSAENLGAQCMENGKCSKNFPKPFREHTTITENAYAATRRRDTGQTHDVRGKQVDNRWVVPYSPWLIWKYQCHINVECIASIKAVKYIYKYVYKGHDRVSMQFGTVGNEVRQYLDARYVSACESLWHIFQYPLHGQAPNVVRLQVHLPDEQFVTWRQDGQESMPEVVLQGGRQDSTLTAYFKANVKYPNVASTVLYQNFPSQFVFSRQREWKPRQRGFAIGRMNYAPPTSDDHFYLRLLLTQVAGSTSFEDLRTYEEVTYPSFKDACLAHGLLEDDQEWDQCLREAAAMQPGRQLRHLFVTILRDCNPSDPAALWNTYWPQICNDLRYRLEHDNIRVNPSDEDVIDYGLFLIDQLLQSSRRSLKDWPSMPQVTQNWNERIANHLIAEQHNYDREEQAQLAAENEARLNPEQRATFDQFRQAIADKTGQIFFLHGPGGTGKTFLYHTLCYRLRSEGKIVICVASSGIASLLLPGGCTSHSSFKIPILINASTVCTITKTSPLAALICTTDLIIWDEAPMQHRHIHEAVDRRFQDIRGSDLPFGGDFQQILPVIKKGSRPEMVGTCD